MFSRISVQGDISSGVMLLGWKPIANFLAGRTPSTDPPCQKDQEPFSLAVAGIFCMSFPENVPHISVSIRKMSDLHWRNTF